VKNNFVSNIFLSFKKVNTKNEIREAN